MNPLRLLAITSLALSLSCGSQAEVQPEVSEPAEDVTSALDSHPDLRDIAQQMDFGPEEILPGADQADEPREVSSPDGSPRDADGPTCIPPGIIGRLMDDGGQPIAGGFLFLCGIVEGKDTCNRGETGADGRFVYQNLPPGFTHMEVNAALAGNKAGRIYAGISIQVSPESESECRDLGDIPLPTLDPGPEVSSALGGSLDLGELNLEIPPGCPFFPDYQEQAQVSFGLVSPQQSWLFDQGLAIAFAPFGATCEQGMRLVADRDDFLGREVLVNDLDHGGLRSIGALTPDLDGKPAVMLPFLTWVFLGD